jgi:hypothetical protein
LYAEDILRIFAEDAQIEEKRALADFLRAATD